MGHLDAGLLPVPDRGFLFVGLTWFQVFTGNKALYMAALAFSAYGIHWFAMGWNRYRGTDVRPNGFMTIPFIIISVLGLTVFFDAGDWPLGVLFSGLTAVYVAEFFASFGIGARPAGAGREPVNLGEKGSARPTSSPGSGSCT